MPSLKQCQDKVHGLIAQQKTLLADEEKAWTEKADAFKALEADVKTALDELAAVKTVADLEGLIDGGAKDTGPAVPPATKSLGEQVTEDPRFLKIVDQKGQRFSSGQITIKGLTVSDPVKPGVIPAQNLPGIVGINLRPLTIRDLLLDGTMTAASVTYLVETVLDNAAAAVARGGLKPESAFTLDTVIEAAKKIATTLKTPDEILDDLAFARSYIEGRLRDFVLQEEEDQLLNGSGSGANVNGLLNRSGLASEIEVTGQLSRIDAIFQQISAIRSTAYVNPTALVIDPTDWEKIVLTKDADGRYLGGGPFTAAAGQGLWGLPVAVTSAIAPKTSLVITRTAAQVLQRSALTVEATNTDQDDFVKNRVTFRAEERVALCVYRPNAFGLVVDKTP